MEINFSQIIFQIVNFTILLLVLKKFLYKPILNILEQRAKKIHEGLEAAEKSIEEKEKIYIEKKKVIVEAEKNANKILEGARLQAKRLDRQLSERAEKNISRKIKKAEELAKSRVREEEHELEKQFARTVVNTTEALLKDSLGLKEQRSIIKRQTEKLKKIHFVL